MGKSISTRKITQGFRQLSERLLTALLPSSCLLCGAASGPLPLCQGCAADLPALPDPHCPLCLDRTTHGERCGACQMRPPHFDRVIALHAYAFPVDQLVHQLKYAARLSLARYWGAALGEKLAGETNPASHVMALPLHPGRLAERGYNQSLEIARQLARRLDIRLDGHSLVKTQATRPQAELPLKERQHNLRGVFACVTDLQGAQVLLVDDVLTTGATLDEAARVLKLHGAAQVSACVVARTLRH
ncbi:ComF family protein [Azovibrio restrictus]|uniref:ComF family protein n=1 Tax=Azovibrio restrictus TaxID=146938 RepID=UPI0026ED031E|nr:ComF family protein [Azovibrio restrictus]